MRGITPAFLVAVLMAGSAFGAQQPARSEDQSPAVQQTVEKIIARERALPGQLRTYTPLAESYIQYLRPDEELGAVPVRDDYFLAQLDLRRGLNAHSFHKPPNPILRFLRAFANIDAVRMQQLGLVQPMFIDRDGLDRSHYAFSFVRREFLGDVRTLVFDVKPRQKREDGRFVGRIWVEDQGDAIVRFNGTYQGKPLFARYVHFDSWRVNTQFGLWLPAYIYFEESDAPLPAGHKSRMKGETRIWGYGLNTAARQDEFTNIVVEAVPDRSDSARDYSPLRQQRAWEREAEDNVIERLQKAGLIAPEGEVNKILETVVNNLEVTNKLNIDPEVRARVLLTSQLESFTIGHTIVLSRGLIDVLPDEAALAMVLSHELAHIVLGHQLDTKYAFNDRMFFPDNESFRHFQLRRTSSEEDAADVKAMAFLKNSPYSDKLANAGLFLKALAREGPELPHLVSSHFGNRLVKGRELLRLADLMQSAPALQPARTDQIAALPLGSRIKQDPWDAHVEMLKAAPVVLQTARDKMQFELTPVILNLRRSGEGMPQTSESMAVPRPPR